MLDRESRASGSAGNEYANSNLYDVSLSWIAKVIWNDGFQIEHSIVQCNAGHH